MDSFLIYIVIPTIGSIFLLSFAERMLIKLMCYIEKKMTPWEEI